MRKIPKTLKPVKVPEKPKISLNLSDRLNQVGMWLSSSIAGMAGKVIGWLIPSWVWLAFLGLLVALVLIYGVTR